MDALRITHQGSNGSDGRSQRPKLLLLSTALAIVSSMVTQGAQTSDFAVQVSAQVQSSPAQINLSWPQDSSGTPTSYIVSRKLRDATDWSPVVTLPGTTISYSDGAVSAGVAYEYQVQKTASGYNGFGYVYAGVEVPATHNRGKVILIVDNAHTAALASELSRLEQDLRGDGWSVLRHDVASIDSPASVKALIQADYAADPVNVKSVFLFGHVPVAYSGNIVPDGHNPDHLGAWPADIYYGDLDGAWSDTRVNSIKASSTRNQNIPGDGKFDESTVPSYVKLQVGRVDLSNLPSFAKSETELLRQYLNKDYNFRHKLIDAERRGLVVDAFGTFNNEAFAANGWRNFAPFFGAANISSAASGEFVSTLSSQSFLWAYGCGSGTFTSAAGVGTTADFASNDLRAVFTAYFGSYFGDWDSQDNFLRAALASPSYTLTSAWAGRPNWFFHHMGLGEPIGFSAAVSQNNLGTYQQQNYGAFQVHVALLGDPTLRLHTVAPASGLASSVTGGDVTLTWTPSSDQVSGYHIYRSTSPSDSFARINSSPVTSTSFTDTGVAPGNFAYEVRAEKLEVSGSGSYFNLSQGIFASATVAAPVPTPAPEPTPAPPVIPVISITVTDPTASEVGPDVGTFTVTSDVPVANDLTISLKTGGSATNGTDYQQIDNTITIPAGATSVELPVKPIPDTLFEGKEGVAITLLGNSAYIVNSSAIKASLTIQDTPAGPKVKIRRR
ncbi:MAG: fibronectin type III domain-containing protein [Pedosphaera sp.]|nr:fibronectin type III domain-containing protein [Pedosphaera sp.]